MSASVQNLEEAAAVASEFISNLDNLPNEVQHLLLEIKHKERRCQELQQEITKDQARYIKHSLRQASASAPPGSGATTPPITPAKGTKAHLPVRIAASYAEMEQLADEKLALAQRIIALLNKTRARLDADLARVRVLQGEAPEDVKNWGSPGKRAASAALEGASSPVVQIGESLRGTAYGSGGGVPAEVLPLTPVVQAVSGGGAHKKRRIGSGTSIKLPSPVPAVSAGTPYVRSRLSRQIQAARPADEEVEAEAEVDEEVDAEDAEEDLTLYCLCHKQSYGDMIGCDNAECPYQWFHITCVGVKTPLPDKWYCPECKGKGRKGRKK